MTTEQATMDESTGESRSPSYGSGVARILFTAIWLIILTYIFGLLGDQLLQVAGKSKLVSPGNFPLNATLLGFVTLFWAALPVIYGVISTRWLERDAIFIAPGIATIIFALATLLDVKWSGIAGFVPIAFLIAYVAVASFLGVVGARIVSLRRARREDNAS